MDEWEELLGDDGGSPTAADGLDGFLDDSNQAFETSDEFFVAGAEAEQLLHKDAVFYHNDNVAQVDQEAQAFIELMENSPSPPSPTRYFEMRSEPINKENLIQAYPNFASPASDTRRRYIPEYHPLLPTTHLEPVKRGNQRDHGGRDKDATKHKGTILHLQVRRDNCQKQKYYVPFGETVQEQLYLRNASDKPFRLKLSIQEAHRRLLREHHVALKVNPLREVVIQPGAEIVCTLTATAGKQLFRGKVGLVATELETRREYVIPIHLVTKAPTWLLCNRSNVRFNPVPVGNTTMTDFMLKNTSTGYIKVYLKIKCKHDECQKLRNNGKLLHRDCSMFQVKLSNQQEEVVIPPLQTVSIPVLFSPVAKETCKAAVMITCLYEEGTTLKNHCEVRLEGKATLVDVRTKIVYPSPDCTESCDFLLNYFADRLHFHDHLSTDACQVMLSNHGNVPVNVYFLPLTHPKLEGDTTVMENIIVDPNSFTLSPDAQKVVTVTRLRSPRTPMNPVGFSGSAHPLQRQVPGSFREIAKQLEDASRGTGTSYTASSMAIQCIWYNKQFPTTQTSKVLEILNATTTDARQSGQCRDVFSSGKENSKSITNNTKKVLAMKPKRSAVSSNQLDKDWQSPGSLAHRKGLTHKNHQVIPKSLPNPNQRSATRGMTLSLQVRQDDDDERRKLQDGIYFERSSMCFTPTHLADLRNGKLKLVNSTRERVTLKVELRPSAHSADDMAFIIKPKFQQVTLEQRSFFKIPIRFQPNREGQNECDVVVTCLSPQLGDGLVPPKHQATITVYGFGLSTY